MRSDDAYARCEEITRNEAKNFAFGIRLLPPPKRSAMSAIYAFARRIDDISDGDGAPDEKLAELAVVRRDVDGLRRGHARDDDPVLVALADTGARYPVPWDAFDELVEGCEHDAIGASYPTFPALVAYCRLVAGSVGRLSLAVFGTTDGARAPELADALGVALQLTNILRDIVEDREMGRIYLPSDDIARFGADPELTGPADSVAALVAFEAVRAREWFDEGLQLLPLLDHRSRACVGAMAGIYRRLLTRITARPGAVLEGRVSLPTWEKVLISGRGIAGLDLSAPAVTNRVGA
jgi:phytoene synthase